MINAVYALANGAFATGAVLKDIVTAEMMSGVLDEIIGVLPVALPTMIGFIAIRKGISFIRGILASA